MQSRSQWLRAALLLLALLGPVFHLVSLLTRGLAVYYGDAGRLAFTYTALGLSAAAATLLVLRRGSLALRLVAGTALLVNLGTIAWAGRLWSQDMQRSFAEVEMAPVPNGQAGIVVCPADHSTAAAQEARAIEEAINKIVTQLGMESFITVRASYPVFSADQARSLSDRMRAHVVIWKEESAREYDPTQVDATLHLLVRGANETELTMEAEELMQLMTTADTLSLAYTRSTEGDPVSPWATRVIAPVAAGFSCLALDQPMWAAAQFSTALEVDGMPAAAQAAIHSYFATSLLYLERADLATQEYNLSNEKMPNAMAYTGLGNVALANHDWAAAEEAYGRAVAVDPYDPRPYCGLSIIASREYQVARAVSACQQAIALDETNAVPYAFLGMAYELQGDIETAQRAYQSSAYYAGPQAGLYVASLERAEAIVRNPPTPVPTATPRPIPTATPVPTSAIYTVEANDSLSGVAEEFDVSLDMLREINGLRTNEEMLYIGQELLIPAKP